jgi:hypothetical protein
MILGHNDRLDSRMFLVKDKGYLGGLNAQKDVVGHLRFLEAKISIISNANMMILTPIIPVTK